METPFDTDVLARIEEAGLNASAPPQQRLVDGWLVRFSPGKAKRARCVNAISPGRLSLDRKLALCRSVFDEARLPMLLRITPFSQPEHLDAQLEARGMHRIDDTRVMVCETLAAVQAPALADGLVIADVGHEAFAQWVGGLRGSPLSQRQAHGHRLANSPVPFSAVVLKRDGEVVACGQMAREADMVGLYDVYTAAAARGQGLAGMLCAQLLSRAAAQGARVAYLQVEGDNLAARAVYGRLGFRDAYAYHYRASDPGAA